MNAKLLCVSLGSLLFLSSFLSQQFVFEKWNTRSARIREANAYFTAYQSNNAIFNAIFEVAREDRRDRIRQLQLINYQRALRFLWGEVPPATRAALAAKGVHEMGTGALLSAPTAANVKKWSAEVQAQINTLQGAFRKEQKRIERYKQKALLVFASLYLVGSLLVIVGNLIATRKDSAAD